MHKFLRAIGISCINKNELKEILKKIEEYPTFHKTARDSEGNEFTEMCKEFGDSFGIALRGIYNEKDEFEMEYYYPYFCGSQISSREFVEVERYAEKESYAGICDEVKIGVTLIFYLQNIIDYLAMSENKNHCPAQEGIILGALSTEGKILLPINKTKHCSIHGKKQKNDRSSLIAAARDGDEDAIENLTLEDIDIYSMLSRRIAHEDILSIVDNYFMPYGIESDQYSVLGEIIDVHLVTNQLTGEKVYELQLQCNEMMFSVCINQTDLLGEPQAGRRFKGNVWMQGKIKL